MKKKFLAFALACIMLMVCAVSIYAYSASTSIGPSGAKTTVSITWSAESVTASNGSNSKQSDSYCKAYIYYDNGEYISKWDTSKTTAISATATHSVYPPGATRISTYDTTHEVEILGSSYSYDFSK